MNRPADTTASLPLTVLSQLPPVDEARADARLADALQDFPHRIIVLDDDPTGVQTVHGIHVYTDWQTETLREAFADPGRLFYILTNSRSFTAEQTRLEHQRLAERVWQLAGERDEKFLLISRSDSTLRGHYPLETETLRQTLEARSTRRFDGEVICPFFVEGGRFTLQQVHYVQEGQQLVPAAQTEFARDKTFGYTHSHLGLWCEEKTRGRWLAREMIYFSLEELRTGDLADLTQKLLSASDFNKIIVDAAGYVDIKIFAAALIRAMAQGKQFLLRSAAALPKILGGIADKPLLQHADLVQKTGHGGIVLVGSHVNKTSRQLAALLQSDLPLVALEFNQHRVLEAGGLAAEVAQTVAKAEQAIARGQTAVIYTRRERFDLPESAGPEAQLRISTEISDAMTSIIGHLKIQPNFIVAKGGITSSDVGTKALRVRKALVAGQISPGVPVWQLGPESKFPGMAYVIFPGNVGEIDTLSEITGRLIHA